MKTVPEPTPPTVPAAGGASLDRETHAATAPRRGVTAPAARQRTVAGPAGAVAVALLVAGVAAAVDPGGLRPYTMLRWAVVGVAATVAGAAVRWRAPRPVVVLGACLLGWMALATATAPDPVVALVGHPRRHLGLAGWIVCALALLAGTGLGGRARRRLLGRVVAAAGAVTGVATAADLVGWDPFGTRFAGGRVGGLLGQPLYLAVVALLVGPVAVGVASDRSQRRAWRIVGVVGGAGAALALAGSQTRGAWIGALVATGVVAARRRRGRAVAAVAGAAAVALAVVIVAAGPRLTGLADRDAPGGIGRLDEWRVAVRVVADHPVMGTGPEGYRIAAPAHIDDDYARRHGRDEVVDRAHSAPLDVAATAGVPAALLYVGLVGWVVVRCARVVGRSSDPVLVGLAAGVVAWSVQLLVGFPIAEVDPLAWLFAGVVVVATSAQPAGRRRRGPHADDRTRGVSGAADGTESAAGLAGAADGGESAAGVAGSADGDVVVGPGSRVRQVVLGALAAAVGVGGLTAVAADRALARAEDARARGDVATALAEADRATDLRPDDIDAWYLAADIAVTPEGLPALDNGLDRVEEALDRRPRDPALRHLHTALLVERAQRSGLADDVAAAEASARDLVADDPSSPAAHRALGLASAARGRTSAARAALARAVALDPDDAVTRAALDDLDDLDDAVGRAARDDVGDMDGAGDMDDADDDDADDMDDADDGEGREASG